MTPDVAKHNPDPQYIRSLLDEAGITQHAAARLLGIGERMMRYYVSARGADYRPAPYVVQFALECLAEEAKKALAK